MGVAVDAIAEQAAARLRKAHGALFSVVTPMAMPSQPSADTGTADVLRTRSLAIQRTVARFAYELRDECERAAGLFADWIDQRALVRLIASGGGRAAVLMSARRLAAAGARVQFDDDVLPVPDPLHGGGVVAVFDNDDVAAVSAQLARYRGANRDLGTLAIGISEASSIGEHCDALVWLALARSAEPYESAADVDAHVISQVLDALVVQAMLILGRVEPHQRPSKEMASRRHIAVDG